MTLKSDLTFGRSEAKSQDALLKKLKDLADEMRTSGMHWTADQVERVWSQSGAGTR